MNTPDWLDDVLTSPAVDDDGFATRVLRVGASRTRSRRLLRLLVACAVLFVVGSCTGVGMIGERWLTDQFHFNVSGERGNVDGATWLAANRARYRAAIATFDTRPGLQRRDGTDAGPALVRATPTFSGCDERKVCDSGFLVGLAGYDIWRLPTSDAFNNDYGLRETAKQHLSRALALPLVDGEPAPFVAAARDVEALGRLWLGHSHAGIGMFRLVAEATERARALGRDGGVVPTLSIDEVAMAIKLWVLTDLFVSPAASDDDVAFLQQMKSGFACAAAVGIMGYDLFEPFIDEEHLYRGGRRMAGCGRVPAPVLWSDLSADEPPVMTAALLLVQLPPWRGRIDALAHTIPVDFADKSMALLPPLEPR